MNSKTILVGLLLAVCVLSLVDLTVGNTNVGMEVDLKYFGEACPQGTYCAPTLSCLDGTCV